jgi:hypothetical protein
VIVHFKISGENDSVCDTVGLFPSYTEGYGESVLEIEKEFFHGNVKVGLPVQNKIIVQIS